MGVTLTTEASSGQGEEGVAAVTRERAGDQLEEAF